MGRYNIPQEFRNQQRYFKIFKKKSLIYTAASTAIGYFIIFKPLLDKGKVFLPFIVLGGFVVIAYGIGHYSFYKESKYNANIDLDVVIFRKLKKMFKKEIYVSLPDRNEE